MAFGFSILALPLGFRPRADRKSKIQDPKFLACAALGLALAACWILPLRLLSSPGGSYYAAGYIGDEYVYAQRLQPLCAGCTPGNPINGIGDPEVISPYFLENLCRQGITLLGWDAPRFFWTWRFLFPLFLLVAVGALACACLPRTRRPWAPGLRLAGGAAGFAFLYCVYDLLTAYPPRHGFLERVPTNIEYILSAVQAALFIRLLDRPTVGRGAWAALWGAGLIYIRPYAALPWGPALAFGLTVLTVVRRVPLRTSAAALGALSLALIPLLYVVHHNGQLPIYAEMLARYLNLPAPDASPPYAVHPHWALYLGLAALIAALARFSRRPVFNYSCALALAALPFVCGLLKASNELLSYDRFGVFYLVALLGALLLAVGRCSLNWSGHAGWRLAKRVQHAFLALAAVGVAYLAYSNLTLDFPRYAGGTYASVAADLRFLPAYNWVRENTPAGALFLVDDGYDWSRAPRDVAGWRELKNSRMAFDDLFQLVSRRRPVFTMRLYGNALATADVDALEQLQLGTFGYPVDKAAYLAALRRFRPGFVLWRKTAPVPSGYGTALQQMGRVVYRDEVCEVWQLSF